MGCQSDARSDVSAVGCVFFTLPYARLSPIPRKDGEETRKEVYLVEDYDTTPGRETKLRIELYYNNADEDKAIQGIDIASLPQPGATSLSVNIVSVFNAVETAGVVTMFGYNPDTGNNDAMSLSGLARRTDGMVTLYCLHSGGICDSPSGMEAVRTVTYVGDQAVGGAP
jgi:hypothetical protein